MAGEDSPEAPTSTVWALPVRGWGAIPPRQGTNVPILALFHHDCQQLLQVLFTTEEREQILLEAQKNVPGVDGRPTTQPNLIDERFPLTQPPRDFEHAKGRERLRVYGQTLKARKPTNLAKVNLVRQEPEESPAAFLERLVETFRQYTPMTHRPMSHVRQLC